jgi:hypothetical protein
LAETLKKLLELVINWLKQISITSWKDKFCLSTLIEQNVREKHLVRGKKEGKLGQSKELSNKDLISASYLALYDLWTEAHIQRMNPILKAK